MRQNVGFICVFALLGLSVPSQARRYYLSWAANAGTQDSYEQHATTGSIFLHEYFSNYTYVHYSSSVYPLGCERRYSDGGNGYYIGDLCRYQGLGHVSTYLYRRLASADRNAKRQCAKAGHKLSQCIPTGYVMVYLPY